MLSYGELVTAIGELYSAEGYIATARGNLADGFLMSHVFTRLMADAWNSVNQCRVSTEKFVDLEEMLVPALGAINDAKCMMESCVAWEIGLTAPACRSIDHCLHLALADGVRPCLEELELWLSTGLEGSGV